MIRTGPALTAPLISISAVLGLAPVSPKIAAIVLPRAIPVRVLIALSIVISATRRSVSVALGQG
jgi:hypothetical protein